MALMVASFRHLSAQGVVVPLFTESTVIWPSNDPKSLYIRVVEAAKPRLAAVVNVALLGGGVGVVVGGNVPCPPAHVSPELGLEVCEGQRQS
jgi:hypothetical protein